LRVSERRDWAPRTPLDASTARSRPRPAQDRPGRRRRLQAAYGWSPGRPLDPRGRWPETALRGPPGTPPARPTTASEYARPGPLPVPDCAPGPDRPALLPIRPPAPPPVRRRTTA